MLVFELRKKSLFLKIVPENHRNSKENFWQVQKVELGRVSYSPTLECSIVLNALEQVRENDKQS